MASTSAVSMAIALLTSSSKSHPRPSLPTAVRLPQRNVVKASASMKEKAVAGLTAAALAAALVLPDVAEAAQPGVSASLKNFILSILSGGGVLVAIIGAVIGVSNFDPVKRS